MSEYTAARNRTRAKIERAFWDLYLEKKFRRVTVREIVQRAGIHRSTFYIYFEAVEDIFSAIKERQLSLLQEVLATEGEGEGRFIGLLNALQEVYEENRIFLKPLVIDYHSSSFSRAYRQMLKDALGSQADYKNDFSIYAPRGGKRDMMYDVNAALISAMVADTDDFSYGLNPAENNLYYSISGEIHQTLMSRFYFYNAFDIVLK